MVAPVSGAPAFPVRDFLWLWVDTSSVDRPDVMTFAVWPFLPTDFVGCAAMRPAGFPVRVVSEARGEAAGLAEDAFLRDLRVDFAGAVLAAPDLPERDATGVREAPFEAAFFGCVRFTAFLARSRGAFFLAGACFARVATRVPRFFAGTAVLPAAAFDGDFFPAAAEALRFGDLSALTRLTA